MSELIVLQVMNDFDIVPAGPLIRNDVNTESYFVFVEVARNSENRQIPSNRKLHDARARLAEANIGVEFLLKDAVAHDIEAGLRATILHAFINEVRNVFLSLSGARAHVWIEPKSQIDETTLDLMRERAVHFLSNVDITLDSLRSTINQNLPSKLALLGVLRQRSPASLQELAHWLEAQRFVVPSAEWLNRRLDALRKEGAVVRTEGGSYVLTSKSLAKLGTKKNAASPDISRLLAMARLDG